MTTTSRKNQTVSFGATDELWEGWKRKQLVKPLFQAKHRPQH